uniref:Uncharacterized protein n=1 Tax=Siphoviridae sp. ctvph17 TaxID=2825724 RepID=A0A8S5UJG6_9CAUD|nr:MAG TPA: hypothetical protein [Siphoviridae sp. ctvph17]
MDRVPAISTIRHLPIIISRYHRWRPRMFLCRYSQNYASMLLAKGKHNWHNS